MTNKSTKRALLSSALALVVCIAMLIGTTFAWFTDNVSSTNNIIKSGNLDVELEYSTNMANWSAVGADTNVFTSNLWEPGHTEVVYLRVSNKGSLALKYKLGVNVVSEITSETEKGEAIKLSDIIMFGVVNNVTAKFEKREDAISALTDTNKVSAGYDSGEKTLLKGANPDIVAMVVYMPTSVGNEANHATGKAAPQINLGLNVVATQYTAESDSFNNLYDEDSEYPVTDFDAKVSTTAEAKAALASAQDGAVILFEPGIYNDFHLMFNNDLTAKNVTLIGEEGTVFNGFALYRNGGSDAYNTSVKVDGLTFYNITFTQTATLNGYMNNNISFINCEFKNDAQVNAAMEDVTTENLVIKNCDFTGVAGGNKTAIVVEKYNNLTVTDCTFTNIDYNAMQVSDGAGKLIITNNKFNSTGSRVIYLINGTLDSADISGNYFADPSDVSGKDDGNYVKSTLTNVITVGVNEYETNPVYEPDKYFANVTFVRPEQITVSTTAEAQATLDIAKPGDTIVLKAGNYGKLVIKNFWGGNYTQTGIEPITIKGGTGVNVEAVDLNGMNYVTLEDITFDSAKAIQVYNNNGATGDYGNVVDSANNDSKSRGANHITVKNCVFTGTPAVDISKYCSINFMGSNPSSWTYDITVSGCKFLTNAQNYIRMNNVTNNGSVIIENNTFGGGAYATNHHAINASANGGDWKITGNTFINWNPEKCAFATGRSTADGTTDFVITGNTFSNTRAPGDGDDGIIEIKTNSYSTTNYTLDFSSNIFAGALEGLNESTIKVTKP